jgi:acylphosphatase
MHLLVRGRVQGVGFRAFVFRQARALGISGWVRNRADGSVELEAEGEAAALDGLEEAVTRGPAGARVTAVERAPRSAIREERGFQLREDRVP